MKCYTFTELKENIVIVFEEGLRDRENSCIEAVSYCFLIYEADLGYGLEEKILIPLLLGKLMLIRTNRVFIGQYKLFESVANEALLRANEMDLSREECSEVVKLANEVLAKLPKMEIEQDPNAK